MHNTSLCTANTNNATETLSMYTSGVTLHTHTQLTLHSLGLTALVQNWSSTKNECLPVLTQIEEPVCLLADMVQCHASRHASAGYDTVTLFTCPPHTASASPHPSFASPNSNGCSPSAQRTNPWWPSLQALLQIVHLFDDPLCHTLQGNTL